MTLHILLILSHHYVLKTQSKMGWIKAAKLKFKLHISPREIACMSLCSYYLSSYYARFHFFGGLNFSATSYKSLCRPKHKMIYTISLTCCCCSFASHITHKRQWCFTSPENILLLLLLLLYEMCISVLLSSTQHYLHSLKCIKKNIHDENRDCSLNVRGSSRSLFL